MKFKDLKQKLPEIHDYFLLALKFLLIISIFNAIHNEYWHIMSVNIFLLVLLFLPQLIKTSYKVKFPKEFEILLLAFVVLSFFMKNIGGLFVSIFFGAAIAFIGFIIVFILSASRKVKKDILFILLFAFCFSVAFGTGLELLKFYIKTIFDLTISQGHYFHAMKNLTAVSVGAFVACVFGYLYMKGYLEFFYKVVKKFEKTNPDLFFSKRDFSDEIKEIIKKGENQKTEFKSTLRTNLYTNEIDKKIEFSALKTISAFLNSQGGLLLIGISDKGEITGIEKDNFFNDDKILLHLSNIIKQKIGKEFLNLINFDIIKIDDKKILVIECSKSDKPVFLKSEQGEEFFIRAGPSSTKISGRELIEYIKKRFEKN